MTMEDILCRAKKIKALEEELLQLKEPFFKDAEMYVGAMDRDFINLISVFYPGFPSKTLTAEYFVFPDDYGDGKTLLMSIPFEFFSADKKDEWLAAIKEKMEEKRREEAEKTNKALAEAQESRERREYELLKQKFEKC